MTDTYRDGVVYRPVTELKPGHRVDLEGDKYADPEGTSEHPEFQFEFETVATVERETAACVRVDFESGFSCGFPTDYAVEVDREQAT